MAKKEDKNLKISLTGIKIALVAMALSLLSSALQIFLSVYNASFKIIASWISGFVLAFMAILLIRWASKISIPKN